MIVWHNSIQLNKAEHLVGRLLTRVMVILVSLIEPDPLQ